MQSHPTHSKHSGMNYISFHLIFNLPLIALLLFLVWSMPWGNVLPAIGFIFVIVMVFTSPWDNHAVKKGIWGFPKGRYLFRIVYLPIEEYAFFILQSFEVILATHLALRFFPVKAFEENPLWIQSPKVLITLLSLLIVWLAIGIFKKMNNKMPSSYNYAWHLLYWLIPVILMQWIIAWPIFQVFWPHILCATFCIGTYLSLADYVAVRQGIWFFDPKQISKICIAKILPWEEVVFFYITSILVAQSYVMLLPHAVRMNP